MCTSMGDAAMRSGRKGRRNTRRGDDPDDRRWGGARHCRWKQRYGRRDLGLAQTATSVAVVGK